MGKLIRVIDAAVFHLAAFALGALTIICLAQVIARYAFHASFVWAEEVSIVILLWVTWFAACFAVKNRAHLRVTFLEDRLKPGKRLLLQMGLNCIAVIFLGIVAFSGRLVVLSMRNITLMSLPSIPINVMYASVLIGSLLMTFYLLRAILNDWNTYCKLVKQGG
jgi:TRAP-type C4-dicarboxylate transport system permease small subunit